MLNWASSATLNDVFRSYVTDGWFARCSRRICLFSQNQPIFLVEHDFWTQAQLDDNPLIFTPVSARRAPPVELVRSLFDLTPSEARVARGLAIGDSLDAIADGGGVTRNTVRAQLRQVMDKTGCTRQSEVTALMSNVALGRDAVKA